MSRLLKTPEQRERKREYERNWRRERYANDPEYRARKIATDKAWYLRMKEEIKQYKLEHGCSVCSYNKCARALQFHHHNSDKEFNISGANSVNKGRDRLWAEIAKCQLICANCHAEIHDASLVRSQY